MKNRNIPLVLQCPVHPELHMTTLRDGKWHLKNFHSKGTLLRHGSSAKNKKWLPSADTVRKYFGIRVIYAAADEIARGISSPGLPDDDVDVAAAQRYPEPEPAPEPAGTRIDEPGMTSTAPRRRIVTRNALQLIISNCHLLIAISASSRQASARRVSTGRA